MTNMTNSISFHFLFIVSDEMYKKVTDLKKKGKKVLIALGGWNDSLGRKYSDLVSSPAYRKIFIDDAVQFLMDHNFDGLDLDWEYPKCWQVRHLAPLL